VAALLLCEGVQYMTGTAIGQVEAPYGGTLRTLREGSLRCLCTLLVSCASLFRSYLFDVNAPVSVPVSVPFWCHVRLCTCLEFLMSMHCLFGIWFGVFPPCLMCLLPVHVYLCMRGSTVNSWRNLGRHARVASRMAWPYAMYSPLGKAACCTCWDAHSARFVGSSWSRWLAWKMKRCLDCLWVHYCTSFPVLSCLLGAVLENAESLLLSFWCMHSASGAVLAGCCASSWVHVSGFRWRRWTFFPSYSSSSSRPLPWRQPWGRGLLSSWIRCIFVTKQHGWGHAVFFALHSAFVSCACREFLMHIGVFVIAVHVPYPAGAVRERGPRPREKNKKRRRKKQLRHGGGMFFFYVSFRISVFWQILDVVTYDRRHTKTNSS